MYTVGVKDILRSRKIIMREFKRILYLSSLASVPEETNSYPMSGIGFLTSMVTVGHHIVIISLQLRVAMCLVIKCNATTHILMC